MHKGAQEKKRRERDKMTIRSVFFLALSVVAFKQATILIYRTRRRQTGGNIISFINVNRIQAHTHEFNLSYLFIILYSNNCGFISMSI
jgi:hypothetical protein